MAENYLDPTREAFDFFKSLPRNRPIHMLNLLRFHKQAQYPADHPNAKNGWSGERAYAEYGKTSAPIFTRVGGSVVWRGEMEAMLIGPATVTWDMAFIAQYPNSGSFMEMVTDPEYRKAVINRQAAVLNSRLVRFSPLKVEEGGFAGQALK